MSKKIKVIGVIFGFVAVLAASAYYYVVFAAGNSSVTINVPVGTPAGNYDVSLTVSGQGSDGSNQSETVNVLVAVPETSASAIGVTISAVQTTMTLPTNSTELYWSTTGDPTSCSASGAWSGPRPILGSQLTGALAAGVYTYTITCTKGGVPDVSDSVTVTVNSAAAPTANLTANGAESIAVIPGQTVNYAWNSTGGTSFRARWSSYGSCSIQGTNQVWSPADNSPGGSNSGVIQDGQVGCSYVITYTVTSASGATASDSVTVSVNPSSCNFTATSYTGLSSTGSPTGSTVYSNGSLNIYGTFGTLTDAQNASVVYYPQNFPANVTSRSTTRMGIGSLPGTGTFTFEIRKDATCAARIAVPVVSPPVIGVTLSASPTSIYTGNSTTLTWNTTGSPTSCWATNTGYGWTGAKFASGGYTENVTPPSNRTFGIECSKSGSTNATASASVTVTPYVAACNPASVGSNQMVGCTYTGTSFNTINAPAPSGAVLSSPAPTNASPLPNVNWDYGGPGTLTDNFSVRWKGRFNFPAGTYIFTTASDDGSRAYFDDDNNGVPDSGYTPSGYLVNDWSNHPIRSTPGPQVVLSAGTRTLVYEMYEATVRAGYGLSWTSTPTPPPPPPPASVDISAVPSSGAIPYNSPATLNWIYSGATDCTISAPATINGYPSGSGSVSTGNLTEDKTYSISCNPGSSSDSVSIDVDTPPERNLIVVKSGQGVVTSTSNPSQPNINCGGLCNTEYTLDTVVTLIATPNPGRIFTGWGGNCSGTPKENNCVLIMDGNKTVIVNFLVDPNYEEF